MSGLGRRSGSASEDERVLLEQRPDPFALFWPIVFSGLVLAAPLIVLVSWHGGPTALRLALWCCSGAALLVAVVRVASWRRTRLVVSDVAVSLRRGIFGRRRRAPLGQIAAVRTRQRLIERLVGRGELELELVGGEVLLIGAVRRPVRAARQISTAIDQARVPALPSEPAVTPAASVDRLDALVASGVITEAERDQKRRELGPSGPGEPEPWR